MVQYMSVRLYKTIQKKESFGKMFNQDINDSIIVSGNFRMLNDMDNDIKVGNTKLIYIKSCTKEEDYFCGCVAGPQLHDFLYNIYSFNNKEIIFVYKKYLGNYIYYSDIKTQIAIRSEPYIFSHIKYDRKEYYEKQED